MPEPLTMTPSLRSPILPDIYLLVLLTALALTSLFSRPLLPIDETRYVTVAWEMWQRGDFLVPYLNGEPYSHKPPLLFWLIHAGWSLFGVNEWWPRLIAPIFGLGALTVTRQLSACLWPDGQRDIGTNAAFVMFGSILWTFFSTLVMFDMLVAFFTLVCIYGLVSTFHSNSYRGWIMVGAGMGLGILAKGPVIFISTLPAALLAPWWKMSNRPESWLRWYGRLLLSVFLSLVISLIWAIPAAQSGGDDYARAILFGQTSGRLVNAFAHRHPWWWYAPMLPAIIFPWPLWSALWRSFHRFSLKDQGIRFCLAWFVPVFVLFSLISGKQVYYLLPVFPAIALLFARLTVHAEIKRTDFFPQALVICAMGVIWLFAPGLTGKFHLPEWVPRLSPWPGILLMGLGAVQMVLSWRTYKNAVWLISTANAVTLIILYIGIFNQAGPCFNVHSIGKALSVLQSRKIPIAHVGKYYGQYQFAGRLKQPLQIIQTHEIDQWLTRNPNGRVVCYFENFFDPSGITMEFVRPYMGKHITILAGQSPALSLDSGGTR